MPLARRSGPISAGWVQLSITVVMTTWLEVDSIRETDSPGELAQFVHHICTVFVSLVGLGLQRFDVGGRMAGLLVLLLAYTLVTYGEKKIKEMVASADYSYLICGSIFYDHSLVSRAFSNFKLQFPYRSLLFRRIPI